MPLAWVCTSETRALTASRGLLFDHPLKNSLHWPRAEQVAVALRPGGECKTHRLSRLSEPAFGASVPDGRGRRVLKAAARAPPQQNAGVARHRLRPAPPGGCSSSALRRCSARNCVCVRSCAHAHTRTHAHTHSRTAHLFEITSSFGVYKGMSASLHAQGLVIVSCRAVFHCKVCAHVLCHPLSSCQVFMRACPTQHIIANHESTRQEACRAHGRGRGSHAWLAGATRQPLLSWGRALALARKEFSNIWDQKQQDFDARAGILDGAFYRIQAGIRQCIRRTSCRRSSQPDISKSTRSRSDSSPR